MPTTDSPVPPRLYPLYDRTRARFPGLLAVLLVLMVHCGTAAAQSESSDSPLAESLFQQGRDLMAQGKLEQACQALEASLELERAAGTLLNLGRCYELRGMLATAWSMFVAAENQALVSSQREHAALARKQHERLEDRVPKVIVEIEGPLEGVELKLDGEVLSAAAVGLELPLDPGSHLLEVAMPNGRKLQRAFSCEARSDPDQPVPRIRLSIPTVPRVQSPDERPASARPDAGKQPARDSRRILPAPVRAESVSREGSPWLVPTLIAGGATGVLVGVGLGFGAVAKADRADCDANLECSATGLRERKAAQDLLAIGYGVGITSGVILASGLAILLWPSQGSASASLALRAGVPGHSAWGVQCQAGF